MKKRLLFTALSLSITLSALLTGCRGKAQYRIAVSQCNDNVWRDKQNKELEASQYLNDSVSLSIVSAYGDWKRQVKQIDSLIDEGVDMIMLSPSVTDKITPAVDRAMEKGIPVVIFDRKIDSENYTAFLGGDNMSIGREIGEIICERSYGKANIIEIRSLEGSSIAAERHEAFMDVVNKEPGLNLIATVSTDGTEKMGYAVMDSLIKTGYADSLDFIFAHTDRGGYGAYQALQYNNVMRNVQICGIDALLGNDGGLQLVREGKEIVSAVYPTGGHQILELAMDILEGRPYSKNNVIPVQLITKNNVDAALYEFKQLDEMEDYINNMHERHLADLSSISHQKWSIVIIVIILILAIALFFVYTRYLKMSKRNQKMRGLIIDTMAEKDYMSKDVKEAPEGEKAAEGETKEEKETRTFGKLLFSDIQDHIGDSNYSVDILAADLNMSRPQLYRKTKALTDQSPVELIRNIRLKRAYQLLSTTDKSVSEVAYSVGFSSPAYFSKCYKDMFGHTPHDTES